MRVGPAEVHPEQLAGEQRRFLAAGAGADLEDHVPFVVRIARHEEHPELLGQGCLATLQGRHLVARERPKLLVRPRVAELAGTLELLSDRQQRAVRLDDRLEPSEFPPEPSELIRIAGDLRARKVGRYAIVLT